MNLSQAVKTSINGDEYYTQQGAVEMIVPYILQRGYKKVWCPFDKADSKFVTVLQDEGFKVNYGHIETGQNFFDYRVVPVKIRRYLVTAAYRKSTPHHTVSLTEYFCELVRQDMLKHQDVEISKTIKT